MPRSSCSLNSAAVSPVSSRRPSTIERASGTTSRPFSQTCDSAITPCDKRNRCGSPSAQNEIALRQRLQQPVKGGAAQADALLDFDHAHRRLIGREALQDRNGAIDRAHAGHAFIAALAASVFAD